MNLRPALVGLALLGLGPACTTPKVSAEETFAPELVVHSIPEGAAVKQGERLLGKAPVTVPLRKGQAKLSLTLEQANYFPSPLEADMPALYQSGGGETWVAMKSLTLGEATDAIDSRAPADVDRAGVAVAKAGRCDEALQFFKRALDMDPTLVRVYKDRTRCYLEQKKYDLAVDSLERYLLAAPDAPDAKAVDAQANKIRARLRPDYTAPANPSRN